jgi:hypothetical protein
MKISSIDRDKLAKTGEEYLSLLAAESDFLVRNEDDIRQLRDSGANALAQLPQRDFDAFLGSLKFKKNGVAHGSYRPLMFTLTISEIFEIFAYFGMAPEYALRTLEYECAGGACSFSFWNFCASNCAPVIEPSE